MALASLLVPGVSIPKTDFSWVDDAFGHINDMGEKKRAREYANQLVAAQGQGSTAQPRSFLNGLAGSPASQTALTPASTAPLTTVTRGQPQGSTFEPFIETVKSKVTNPYGLSAVAATGRAESSFDPKKANATWSDPSQSGEAGTSGGVMSWRGPRLASLQSYAKSKGEDGNGSPQTQGEFLLMENPQLIERLNGAKSVDEAANTMADAWRFAGYDQQGGEAARRRALAQNYYSNEFGKSGGNAGTAAIQAVAPASGYVDPTISAPNGRQPGATSGLRPFRDGETRPNPDGSYSTEVSTTWQLPDGTWTNVPSLWMGKDGPQQFDANDEDGIMNAMQQYEAQSGQSFPRFKSQQEAVAAAEARSRAGGAGAPSTASQATMGGNQAIPSPSTPSAAPVQVAGNASQPQMAPTAMRPSGDVSAFPPAPQAIAGQSQQPERISGELLGNLITNKYTRDLGLSLAKQVSEGRKAGFDFMMAPNGDLLRTDKSGNAEVVGNYGKEQNQFQTLNPAERKAMGIPDTDQRIYQKGPNGQINAVGGAGQTINVGNEVEARRQAAAQAGLKPEDPAYQGFILTGKLPRENEQSLTATDKKAILEADEMVQSTQNVLPLIDRAIELNDQAYSGPTAGIRGTITGALGLEGGEATQELDNVVIAGALTQLKSIFGGAPTEGERQILMDMSGASSKPEAVRKTIFERAKQAAQRRLNFYSQRANELRGGNFYKPGAAATTNGAPPALTSGGSAPPQPDPLGIR